MQNPAEFMGWCGVVYNQGKVCEDRSMTVEALMEEIRSMPVVERKRLVKLIIDSFPVSESSQKSRSILEFEGVGAEIWHDIDAQDYVNQLRDEWGKDQ